MKIILDFRQIYPKLALWLHDRSGATAIEYTLIATGVSVGLVAGTYFFGDHFNAFDEARSALSGAVEDGAGALEDGFSAAKRM